MRFKKVKQAGAILVASRHNKRSNQREWGGNASIDAQRTVDNYALAGPSTPDEVAALAAGLMQAAGVTKVRRDAVRCIEIVISIHKDDPIDRNAYFLQTVEWAGERFGRDNVLSADVHMDESSPHCHILILPLKDGRMNGSAMVGGKASLSAHLRSFEEQVMAGFGVQPCVVNSLCEVKGAIEEVSLVHSLLQARYEGILQSPVGKLIDKAIAGEPRAWLAALGHRRVKTPRTRRPRTLAQVFTSKGKGPQRPRPGDSGYAGVVPVPITATPMDAQGRA